MNFMTLASRRAADGELEMVLRPNAAAAAELPRSPLPPFIVLCLAMGAALHAQPFAAAAAELHVHQGVAVCVVLAVAALFYWAILSVNFFVKHPEGEPDVVLGLARTAAAAPTRCSSSRRPLKNFVALCLGMGALLHVEPLVDAAAKLHIHPNIVAGFVFAVTALFNGAILSLNIHLARRAEEREPKMLPSTAASAARSPTSSASRCPLQHFSVLCFVMGALLHVEPLVAAAAELHIHPSIVAGFFLAVTSLFNWAVLSLNIHVARRAEEREKKMLPRTAAPNASPTSSASRRPLQHFIVHCLGMGALLHVEPLVDATAELHIHPNVVAGFVIAVTALFNGAILSLNIHVARRAEERVNKMLPRTAASAARYPHAAHLAFLLLAALVSASWFVEPFVAAAELWLPSAVIVVFVLLFATLFNFNVSTHGFRSFFLLGSPSAAAASGQGQGVGAITAGVMGIGIAIAVCLIGAGGSTPYVFAPARS